MNKITSGILAVSIYLGIVFLILLYYNVHKIKSKNYVEKNSNRVTVTLVNSDKTVFNRNSKISIPKKPTPRHHSVNRHHIVKPIPPKHIVKPKTSSKKELLKRQRAIAKKKELERVARAKEEARRRTIAKKKEAERVAKAKEEARKKTLAKRKEAMRVAKAKEEARKRAIAKRKEAMRVARAKEEARKRAIAKRKEAMRVAKAKEEAKKRAIAKRKEAERVARIKAIKEAKAKKERERLARIRAERERKKRLRERSRSLFSSIKTPPKHSSTRREPRVTHQRSHVRHQSSIADNIRNTHLSGRVSNKNRERGVVNAYIAKVKNQLNNWNAQSDYKGQSATIKITIMNSGHFRYTVRHSTSGALTKGLKRFLDQLNRIGLGVHRKSTPYIIEVTFRAK